MQKRFGLDLGAFMLLATLGVVFLFLLVWAGGVLGGAIAENPGRLPWNWILGGLLVGVGVALVLVRPIIIPWTVMNVRRAFLRIAPPTSRYEPAATEPMPSLGRPTLSLAEAMEEASAAETRAYEVHQILEAARRPDLARPLEVEARS